MTGSFKYTWAYGLDDVNQHTAPLIFVGENGKPLAVSNRGDLFVVRDQVLVNAESWTVTWDQATISYVLP